MNVILHAPLIRAISGILAVAAFAVLNLGPEAWPALIETAVMISGLIGIAYVMRYRVVQLEEAQKKNEAWQQEHERSVDSWKEGHSQSHAKLDSILNELHTSNELTKQRLVWLENGVRNHGQ